MGPCDLARPTSRTDHRRIHNQRLASSRRYELDFRYRALLGRIEEKLVELCAKYETLKPMIGGTLNFKAIRTHWNEILRLATSIKQGTVTASLMLRKLGSYPRQNGLAVALRELGRIERTLFILSWLQSVELRRRVQVGLNKGEARNALARAVFLCRLGEIRDRSFEQQRFRASGLTLVTAAIVLWNTVYIERAIDASARNGQVVDAELLKYLSPLGWEHINLTGDYQWRGKRLAQDRFRPLRIPNPAIIAIDNMLLDYLALSCDQLNANVQLGRPTHGSDSPPSLATRRIFLNRCLQNEQVGNIVRVTIPSTEHLFELLHFG